jgi:hypothetical protein
MRRHDGAMPEPPTNPEPVVYQLRVVLRGVSPLIWRRRRCATSWRMPSSMWTGASERSWSSRRSPLHSLSATSWAATPVSGPSGVAVWSGGGEEAIAAIRAAATRIQRTADRILTALQLEDDSIEEPVSNDGP